jgi:hypothetical protein
VGEESASSYNEETNSHQRTEHRLSADYLSHSQTLQISMTEVQAELTHRNLHGEV